MKFQDYQSKPVTRRAHRITEDDKIVEVEENTYRINDELTFKAFKNILTGDYVGYLNEEDVYHCSAEVFHERNVIEGAT